MSGFNPREPAPADSRGKYWAVTINSQEDDPDGFNIQRSVDDIESLHENGELTYAVGQWERGETTGRLHLQCYLIFKERKYCNWVAARIYRCMLFLSQAAWAKKGIKYCKDVTKDSFVREGFELGRRPDAFQGKRTDLDDVNEMISENQLTTYREVNDYRVSVAARHTNWVNWRLAEASKDEYLSEDRYDDPYVPRVWQYWLARILNETRPAERKVIFIVDKLGNAGKTRFTFEFSRSTNKRFQAMRAMPKRDMASALEYRREILWIDIPRGRLAFIDTVYVFMEEAKDGIVGNEKYGSHTQYNKRMHVVCFMNDDVDIGQNVQRETRIPPDHGHGEIYQVQYKPAPLSRDRYAIWDLELTPGLTEPWSRDSQWFDTCPPFIAFDMDWSQIEYNPPLVANSGPEFNGDMAGDGPTMIPDVAVRLKFTIAAHSNRTLARLRSEYIEANATRDELYRCNEFCSNLSLYGVTTTTDVRAVDLYRTHQDYQGLGCDVDMEYHGYAFDRWLIESIVCESFDHEFQQGQDLITFPLLFIDYVNQERARRGGRSYRGCMDMFHNLARALAQDLDELAIMDDLTSADIEVDMFDDEVWTFMSVDQIPESWRDEIMFGVSGQSINDHTYYLEVSVRYNIKVDGNCASGA